MTFAVCFWAGGFLLRMHGGYVIIYLEAVKMSYGVPHQGSKNKICKFVIDNLQSGDVFVDLFAGGCAITHAAMLASKWNYFVANDKRFILGTGNKNSERIERLFVQERYEQQYYECVGKIKM